MSETRRFGSEMIGSTKRPSAIALGIGGAGRNILSSIRDDPKFANMKAYEVGVSDRLPELPFIHVDMQEIQHTFESKISLVHRPMNNTEEKFMRRLKGMDIMYILSGMGGETGSLTSYTCAQLGDKLGLFTIALVALPFKTEGKNRHELANEAKSKISEHADVVAAFHNSRLMRLNPYISMNKAFDVMNSIIRLPMDDFNSVITSEDIPHLKRFCKDVDEFRIGAGYGKGQERGKKASLDALRSPWLDDMEDYETILAVVTSGIGHAEMEAQDALDVLIDRSPNSHIMWGLRKDPSIGERTRVTILAGD